MFRNGYRTISFVLFFILLAGCSNSRQSMGKATYLSHGTPEASTFVLVGNATTDSQWIAAIYHNLFNRGASDQEIQFWVNAIAGGMTRSTVAMFFLRSPENYRNKVTNYYQRFLRRDPDAAINGWVNIMVNGVPEPEIIANFLSTSEYYAASGSTPTGWLNRIYQDVLNRPADANGVAHWLGVMSRLSRHDIAFAFATSAEYYANVLVPSYYQKWLGRGADPGGDAAWTNFLLRGASPIDVEANFIASDEFYQNSTSLPPPPPPPGNTRDKLRQPFSSLSPWNMPIGSGAVYVAANIPAHTFTGIDEDILALTPSASLRDVYINNAGWSQADRCQLSIKDNFQVPIPDDFIVGDMRPNTPNNAGAFLLGDARTIVQIQPVSRCGAGGPVTYTQGAHYPSEDIYGLGIQGAHGGSGLSSIGGTLRLGELVPGAPPIRHALKISLNGSTTISSALNGYRWPAVKQDSCFPGCYGGSVPALRMGALLALKPDFNIGGLRTVPAQMIAWTLQNYGAYLVDNSGWSDWDFAAERSPAGRVKEEFHQAWGYYFTGGASVDGDSTPNSSYAFGQDMLTVMAALYVIDNNSPSSTVAAARRASLWPCRYNESTENHVDSRFDPKAGACRSPD